MEAQEEISKLSVFREIGKIWVIFHTMTIA
jgi:hypothetical protein